MARTRKTSSAAPIVALGLLAGASTCATLAPPRAARADRGPAPVVRLLERLDRARLDAPGAAAFFGALPPARGDALRFADDFAPDGPFPGPWRSRAFAARARGAGEAALRVAPRSERPRRDGVRTWVDVPAGDFLGCALPADADAAWLLRAWVQPILAAPPEHDAGADAGAHDPAAPPEARPSLSFVPLDHVPATGEAFARDLREHAAEYLRRPRDVVLPRDAGFDAWHELRLVARPYAGRAALAISLGGGDRGLRVDRFELRRLTPAEALALSADETVEPASHPLRRRIELDLETWDCLALPVAGALELDLDVPARAPRLRFALAALVEPGAAPGAVGVELAIDGASCFRREAGARFEGAALDLAAHAGRRVALRIAARGPPGAVALVGAPTLLGNAAATATGGDAAQDDASAPTCLVVLSLDTLRADHVGCYGGAPRTPAIDALAARGTRFARVLSPASYTLPTHLSLFSGQDPLVHDTVASTDPMDPLRTVPLAARLREAGWRTAAFTAGGLVHPRYGFGVGFDRYSIRDPGGIVGLHRRIGDASDDDAQPGEDRMQPVLDWLAAGRDVPSFLFLHTYLVHNYRPHQRWLDAIDGGARPTREELAALRTAGEQGDPAALSRLRALYHASVEQADAEIVARLLEGLDALGLADRTLVALVSDHGEEFFEHRMVGHGDELWHTLTSVPWIVAGPGVPRGAVIDAPVALADVAPTLAGRLGLDDDPRVLARDRFAPDAFPDDESFTLSLRRIAQRLDQDALVLWPWKAVRRRAGEPPWPVALYHLEDDPAETRDLAQQHPARAAGLARLLDARVRELERQAADLPSQPGRRRFEMSPELERMLDQLGYVEREGE